MGGGNLSEEGSFGKVRADMCDSVILRKRER